MSFKFRALEQCLYVSIISEMYSTLTLGASNPTTFQHHLNITCVRASVTHRNLGFLDPSKAPTRWNIVCNTQKTVGQRYFHFRKLEAKAMLFSSQKTADQHYSRIHHVSNRCLSLEIPQVLVAWLQRCQRRQETTTKRKGNDNKEVEVMEPSKGLILSVKISNH